MDIYRGSVVKKNRQVNIDLMNQLLITNKRIGSHASQRTLQWDVVENAWHSNSNMVLMLTMIVLISAKKVMLHTDSKVFIWRCR